MTPNLLTASEARARLRMGRNGFYELIQRREIAVVKIGGKVLIPESEVQRFIEGKIVPARRSYFRSHRQSASSPARTI